MGTFSNQAGNEKKPIFIGLKIRMTVYKRVPGKKKSKKNKLNFSPPTPFCVPPKKPTGLLFSVNVKYSKF